MGKSFHNVYTYQIITWYTLNILQFYLSYFIKTEKKKVIIEIMLSIQYMLHNTVIHSVGAVSSVGNNSQHRL